MSTSDLIRDYVRAETAYHLAQSKAGSYPGTVQLAQIDRARLAANEAFDKMKELMG